MCLCVNIHLHRARCQWRQWTQQSEERTCGTRTKTLPPPRPSPPTACTLALTLTHIHTTRGAVPPPTAPPRRPCSSILSATSALPAVPDPLPAPLRFILKNVQHVTHFPRAGLGGNNCCYIGRAPAALRRCPGFHRACARFTPCPTPTRNPQLRT